MKRLWSAVPAFLGGACIMAAIATVFFLVPTLRVVPLDLDITSQAQTVSADGTSNNRFPAVIFDRCSVTQRKARVLDANLAQQRRSIIVDPSDKRQATLQSAQSVIIERTRDADGKEQTPTVAAANGERTCTDGLLTATIDRVSVNRKSSVPNGTIASIQLESVPDGASVKDVSVDAPRQGFQYKFGFNVKKRDYLYYDLNTRTDNAAKFVGEKVIDGVTTYEFVSEVPETDLSGLANAQGEAALGTMLTMPASWWGITGRDVKPNDSITLHRYAKATRRVFVEPKTGTIVDGREDQHQYFMSPDQSEDTPAAVRDYRLDALKGTFQWEESTVSRQADKAAGYVNQLKWGGVYLPIILAVLGVLLLGLWALLFFRGRKRDADGGDDPRGDDGVEGPYDSPDPSGASALGGISLDKGDDRPTTVLPAQGYDAERYGAAQAGNAQYGDGQYGDAQYGNASYANGGYDNTGYENAGYENAGYESTGYGNAGYTASVTESGRHQRVEDAWAPAADQQQPSGPYRADPYSVDPYAGTQGYGSEPWAREAAPYGDQSGQTNAYPTDTYGTGNATEETSTLPTTDDYQGRHSDPTGTTATTFFGQVDDDGPAVRRHVDPEER